MYFLGDVYLDRAYQLDTEVSEYIFNLEYPLSCNGTPALNKINLCQNKSFISETFKTMPLAVCLANNHIMDYGEEAFSETLKYLEENNIKYFGAGNEKNNFNNPCYITHNKYKVAIFGYSCSSTHAVFGNDSINGSAKIEKNKIVKDIQIVKEKVDYIIIQLHWGDEEIQYPKPKDVKLARELVNAGADLIIGHHAHVIQSMEIYKGKSIYYGLGNFIFPDFNVNSHFNGTSFTSKFQKIQNRKNRQSLVVVVDESLKVSHKTFEFDGLVVKEKKVKIPRWLPSSDFHYKIYYKFWTKKRMIQLFLKNPHIPSMKQIKLLLGIK